MLKPIRISWTGSGKRLGDFLTKSFINKQDNQQYMVFSFKKEVRDINRLKQIVLILFEQGFGYFLDKAKLKGKVPLKKRIKAKLAKKENITPPVRLRLALERLGPTFIKLGQLLSVRPDLIPKEYVKEMEKLQDNVPEFPFDMAEKEIEEQIGMPIKKIFSSFDKKPIASASVAQVYKAKLGNETVAVKIQRPKAKEIMETDIDIMFYIARLLEKHYPATKKYNPVGIVEEFSSWTKNELDFRVEARNAKRFYQNFRGSSTVHIPKIYDDYIREKVLVMEFIDGTELHNIREIKKRKLNFDKIIKNGFDATLTSVFIHGLFHADPHPGNILIMRNNKIGLVDFGIIGHFDDDLKRRSIELLYGIVEGDTDKVVRAFLEMGKPEEKEVDTNKFKSKIKDAIESLQGASLKDIKVSYVLEEVLDIALKCNIRMPTDFILFGKTIVTLEGIALEYNPDFRVIDSIKPFVERLARKKYNPKYMLSSFIDSSMKFKKFITELPEQTDKALKKIQSGTFKIDIDDTDVKKLSLEIDKSSNRLAYGMIIAALLVAGALVIQVGEPVFLGMPLVSFICFLSAVILGFILFSSILKERLLK